MSRKGANRDASHLLESADIENRFRNHIARFGDTPGIRCTVYRSPDGITVTISNRLLDMPEEALRETMRCVLLRLDDPSLPRFGPVAVKWLDSDAALRSMRGRGYVSALYPLDTDSYIPMARYFNYRHRDYLGSRAYRIRHLKLLWRMAAEDLRTEPIASTDPLIQTVCVDERLRAADMPMVLVRYIVWREVCVICAFDFASGSVDRDELWSLMLRYPDAGRMEKLCRELGWECSVPVGNL